MTGEYLHTGYGARSTIRFLRKGENSDRRVLLAEDNQNEQLVIREMLERFDLVVDTVENGALAVQAASAMTYCLILLDRHMPIMDGVEAAEKIRAQVPDSVICGIVSDQTGVGRPPAFDNILQKPVTVSKIRELLQSLSFNSQNQVRPQKSEPSMRDDKVADTKAVLDRIAGHAVIDLDASIYSMLGETVYLAAIEAFCADMAPHLESWKSNPEVWTQDMKASISHQLKGCAGGVGATRLETLATNANQSMRQGVETDFAGVMDELERVIAALSEG